jgi:ABC-type multidrug transport system fused ATPase/permease subunit
MNFIIRSRIYSDILQAEWFGKDKYHSGDTLNRLETDVSTVTNVICSDSPQIVSTLFQLAAALVFMCTMDWRLALILLIITPVFVGLSKVFYSRLRAMTRTIRDTESKVQSHLQESLQHRMVIQSMENEQRMENRLDDLQSLEFGQVVERTRFNIVARTFVSAAFSFGYITAFLWGVYGIYKGSVTFGMMTAFLQIVGQIQRPVSGIRQSASRAFLGSQCNVRISSEKAGYLLLVQGGALMQYDHPLDLVKAKALTLQRGKGSLENRDRRIPNRRYNGDSICTSHAFSFTST